MAILDLGKIKVTNKGAWNSSASYEVDDFVQHGKHTFIAKLGSTNEAPYNASILNSTYWDWMAQGAEAGDWNAAMGAPEYISHKPEVVDALRVDKFPVQGACYNYYRKFFVIMKDGTVRSWGDNGTYSLGDGAQNNQRDRPTTAAIPKKVTSISLCTYSGVAIDEDGDAWCWGYNSYGAFGLGHTTNVYFPTKIPMPSGMTRFIAADLSNSTGYQNGHIIYLLEDAIGKRYVWMCGYNNYGQLGVGNTTNKYTLQKVPTLDDLDVQEVRTEGGQYPHITSRCANGDVYIWGYNGYGQCGSGNTSHQYTPRKVQDDGIPGPVAKMWTSSHGSYGHSYMLLTDGRLYFCGRNNYGILGTGNTSDKNSWTQCGGDGASNVSDIKSTGGNTTWAIILKVDGTIRTVGYNGNGQLGVGHTTNQTTWQTPPANRTYPAGSVNCNSSVKKIFVSECEDSSGLCMFIRDVGEWDSKGHGKAFAFGYNGHGGLGIGHNTNGNFQSYWNSYYPNECMAPETVVNMRNVGNSSERTGYILTSDGQVLSCGYCGSGSHGRETNGENINTYGRINL